MVRAARGIRVLTLASWPAAEQTRFLADHAAGRRRMPAPVYPRHDFSEARRELAAVAEEADPDHPAGGYLRESAESWAVAAQLLENLGRPEAGRHAITLYGSPDQPLPGNGPTPRQAARHFIGIADDLDHELLAPSEQVPVSARALQLQLQGDLDAFFGARVVAVELDPDLIAKAAAGAQRIRLRDG